MTKTQQYIVFGLLGVSLAFNIAIIGVVGSIAARFGGGGDPDGRMMRLSGPQIERMEKRVLGRLPEGDREKAAAIWDRHRAPISAALEELRQARAPLRELLQQQSVNQAELNRLLAGTRAAGTRLNTELHTMFGAMMVTLSQESRSKIVRAMDRHGPRAMRGKRGDRKEKMMERRRERQERSGNY